MQYPALLARTLSIIIHIVSGHISKDIVFPSIFTLSSWMTPLFTHSSLIMSLFTISSLMMLQVLPWRCHSSHFLPCRKTQAKRSQICGWSYAGPALVKTQVRISRTWWGSSVGPALYWWSCRKTRARSSQTCGWSYVGLELVETRARSSRTCRQSSAGQGLLKLQEDSS